VKRERNQTRLLLPLVAVGHGCGQPWMSLKLVVASQRCGRLRLLLALVVAGLVVASLGRCSFGCCLLWLLLALVAIGHSCI